MEHATELLIAVGPRKITGQPGEILADRRKDDRIRSVLYFTDDQFFLLFLIVFRVQRDEIDIRLILLLRHIHARAEAPIIVVIHVVYDDGDPADLPLFLLDDQIRGRQQIERHKEKDAGTPADFFSI